MKRKLSFLLASLLVIQPTFAGLESATHISGLVTTNPTGSDSLSTADDHLRLIKSVVTGDFAGFSNSAVMVRGTEAQGSDADHFVVTISPAPTSYTDLTNSILWFQATHSSASTPLLQVNSLGYKSITDAHGAALDGLSSGALYAFVYDGTNFRLIRPKANVQSFTSSGTWTKYGTPSVVVAECIGAGGGGGSGAGGAASSTREGGTGGGGGAYVRREFLGSVLSATVTVTIGTGGTGGTAATSAAGNAGNTGGTSTFGSFLNAYGGGGGAAGTTSATGLSGGAGGGSW